MAGMNYGKTVSSKSNINLSNIEIGNTGIANYEHSKINRTSNNDSSLTTTTTTLDLNALFTDNIDETVTGTKIVDSHVIETPKEEKSLWDWVCTGASTYAVAYTSVVSGVLDVGESLLDGGAWVVSKAVGIFNDDAEDAMKEFIARDLVSEANQAFYENNSIGQAINDASLLKYDSNLAQGTRKVIKGTTEFAAATALTVCTGGAAAPFVAGVLVGVGNAAEGTYQANGTDTSTLQEVGIVGSGALTGLSWMANGRLGAGAINIGKTMSIVGPTEVLAQMKTEVLSKEFVKTMLKNGLASKQAVGNYVASGLMMADDFVPYITGQDKFELSDVPGLAGHYLFNLGLNVLEDGARDYIGTFKISNDNARKVALRLLDESDNLSEKDLNLLSSQSRSRINTQIRVEGIFTDAQEAARGKYNAFFKNFREHAAEHTDNVRDYAVKLGKEMGLSEAEVDLIYYGSQCHDLGMQGGLFVATAENLKKDLKLNEAQIAQILDGQSSKCLDIDSMTKYLEENNMSPEKISATLADLARGNHPLNSAVAVIRGDIAPDDVDTGLVALLAMSHSKSTSGITDFTRPDQWNDCIDKLGDALLADGMDSSDVNNLTKHLKEVIRDDPETFAMLQMEALCIRDGDAMSALAYKNGKTVMQTGELVQTTAPRLASVDVVPEGIHARLPKDFPDELTKFEAERILGADLPEDMGNIVTKAEIEARLSINAETKSIKDVVFNADDTPKLDADGNPVEITNGFSKRTHAGEINVDFDSTYSRTADGQSYLASAVIKDPLTTPHSNVAAIAERAGEVATYGNVRDARTFTIKLDIPKDSALGQWYLDEFSAVFDAQVAASMKKNPTGYNEEELLQFYKTIIDNIQWGG